jgi:hypothetical protein
LTRPAPAWWWTGGRSRTIWTRPSRSHARRLAGRVRVVGGTTTCCICMLHAACWLLWCGTSHDACVFFPDPKARHLCTMMASGICSNHLLCSMRIK